MLVQASVAWGCQAGLVAAQGKVLAGLDTGPVVQGMGQVVLDMGPVVLDNQPQGELSGNLPLKPQGTAFQISLPLLQVRTVAGL